MLDCGTTVYRSARVATHWQVLLDGYRLVEVGIVGAVVMPKPRPQHRIEPVFLKAGAWRQCIYVSMGIGGRKFRVEAGRLLKL